MKIIGLKEIKEAPGDWSEVFDYRIDLDELKEQVSKYQHFEKFIVIGNGGSITSFESYYRALWPKKEFFILSSMEPRLIKEVREKFEKDKTLIIVISKSGFNLGPIEILLGFLDYPAILVITNKHAGALREIAEKRGYPIIEHPEIGGRFSGATATAIVPAILAGFNSEEILSGIYAGYQRKDEAYTFATELLNLETSGTEEIFLPIYNYYLMGSLNLIVQLMHESVCKNGKGQTFYGAFSPEAQHHTNQRLFGGKRNMAAVFFTYQNQESSLIQVPDELKGIDFREAKLGMVDGIPYQQALLAEYKGTKKDADNKGIPNYTIDFESINESEIGQLVGFWHLVAFYSSILRGVNPFDQPAVEDSKAITVEEIGKLKK